jgi:endogenous inhibitor of DNA gyrase (YacG/DUF329 family)
MPSWSVNCPECKKEFVYSKIDRAALKSDPFVVIPKPAGEKRTCPNCNAESTFAETQMFYRSE